MAGFKRKRTSKSQKKIFRDKGRKGTTKKRMSRLTLQTLAKRMNSISKTTETKSGVRTISDGTEFLHNNVYNMSPI